MELPITLEDIKAAHKRIKPHIHRTPVLTSRNLTYLAGCELHFKCENLQKIGAFKARGGLNAILSLPEEQRKNGVITHSSGNHAQAIAMAAKICGIPAYIIMPETAPEVKKRAVKSYGAQITFCEPTLASREATAAQIQQETGAAFVSPYNDHKVITGQATAALEFLEDRPELDVIFTPVGGGGLLAGTALTAHYQNPELEVYAGEPEGAKDAHLSLKAGKIVGIAKPETIADGLHATIGEKNFAIIKELVVDIFTVSDEEIINAMRLIWERLKIIVEPSGAVPLAALLKRQEKFNGKKAGIILSGGNIDLSDLPF